MKKIVLIVALALWLPVPHAAAQVTFERATADLTSPNPDVRFRAVEMLKDAAYPESAIPLAAVVTDPQDDIQAEAIAAELNIFLADKITERKRVGFIIEVRHKIAADAIFAAGPSALGSTPVPIEVLTALRRAAHGEAPAVALEALYAFGTLAPEPGGDVRRELLRASGPDLAAMLGVPDPAERLATLLVLGRVFATRPLDEPVDHTVGDAVITALNEKDTNLRIAAMRALGAMRYERAIQALTDLFQYYGHGSLAESALDALAHIGHSSSAALFTAQLGNRDAGLRLMAIEGLARVGDPATNAAIQSAASGDRNDALTLGGTFAAVLLAKGPIDPIVQALARPKVHDQAFAYLTEIAPGRTSLFAHASQDPDPRLRVEVADVIGLARDAAGLAIVEPLARDADPLVVRAAERAVTRLHQH